MMTNELLQELEHKLPGLTVTLPTQGLFYKEGVLAPGANPLELTVRPFSMWQEIHFRDPYKVSTGKATKEMILRCCPEVLDPEALASVDVDAIMISARIASYGPSMELDVVCQNPMKEEVEENGKKVVRPVCGEVTKVKVDLYQVAQEYRPVGSLEEWQVGMPNGQIVQLRPIRYTVMIENLKIALRRQRELKHIVHDQLTPEQEDQIKERLSEDAIKTQISFVRESIMSIRSASGHLFDDDETKALWLERVPSSWVEEIDEKLEQLYGRTKDVGTVDFKCPHCGHEQKNISILGDPNRFFGRSSRNSKPART